MRGACCDSPADGKENRQRVFEGGMLYVRRREDDLWFLTRTPPRDYEWKKLDRRRCRQGAGDEYEADTTSDGKAGAGGVHTFTYQAEGFGRKRDRYG